MRLVVIQNDALIQDRQCDDEVVYVGSRPGSAVYLADERVAEQHLVLYRAGNGEWTLETLHDDVAVEVNDAQVTEKVVLRRGDEIRFLDYTLRAYPETETAARPRAEIATSAARLARFAKSQLPPGTIIKKVDEALAVEPGQLTRIGRINLKLAECTAVEQVMDAALQGLFESFGAHRAWIGVRRVNYGQMEYVEGRTLTGQPAELPDHAENYKPRVLDRTQFLLVPAISAENNASVLVGPLAAPEATLGLVYIDSGESGRRFEPRDLDFFMLVLNLVAVQLDAVFKEIARTRAATMDGEVSVAHEIQARITPRKLPQWEQLQFGAFREPGHVRTGDVYDVVRLQNGLAAFLVAHTPATGPLPSMLMAQAQAMFRGGVMHQDRPTILLRTLNWLLYDGQKDHALNCVLGYIQPATGEMQLALAGETGVYIIGQRGEERRVRPAEPMPPLGMDKNAAYADINERLAPAETLVAFTPGVTTAKNRRGEVFGEERFVDILGDGFGQLASSLLKEMFNDLRHFTEGGTQPDDITVVLAHRV